MIFERLEFMAKKIKLGVWNYETKRFVKCKRDIYTASCGQEYVRINNQYVTMKQIMERCI